MAVDSVTDFSQLGELRRQARRDGDAALKSVSEKFEALFIQMMLKSMRQAGGGEDIMGGENMAMYRDMYDQQLAIEMSGNGGIGIARMLQQQLGQHQYEAQAAHTRAPERQSFTVTPPVTSPAAVEVSSPANDPVPQERPDWKTPADFVRSLLPAAKAVASQLGASPQVIIAQAALETGWGQHMPCHADGTPSFNLFGIKADHRWQGERVVHNTLEFDGQQMRQEKAAFRSYSSIEEALQDYASFLQSNPRYQQALASRDDQAYVKGLQSAGYATDPHYADKIMNILDGRHLGDVMAELKVL